MTEENHKNCSQDSRCSGRDSIWPPHEQKREALPIETVKIHQSGRRTVSPSLQALVPQETVFGAVACTRVTFIFKAIPLSFLSQHFIILSPL
jgi:hypothetical protein